MNSKINIRKNKGITIIALVFTIVLLLMISAISITGSLKVHEDAKESVLISELNMLQHSILERYTKAQLTKETLPGTDVDSSELQAIIDEINSISNENITLKGNINEYKKLSEEDMKDLGFSNITETYIVNYNTGEVINATSKTTETGKALYIYARSED